MKIIGGTLKGRNFYMPAGIRPTQDLTRKAIMDILGQDLSNVEFLDLFAGSGAVGLEAISHGARKVVFVEKDPKFVRVIEENLRILGLRKDPSQRETFEVLEDDSLRSIKYFARTNRKFDMIFLDPPYGKDLAKKTLKTLVAYDILQPNCFIIVEHNQEETLAQETGRFTLIKDRRYGISCLAIYEGREL